MDDPKSAPTSITPGSTGSTASRRRSSGPTFESLMAQKRADDPMSLARRQSLSDQKPQSGFFGTMWRNFTRGPQSPTK